MAVARSAVGCMQDWVAIIANRCPHLADYPLLDDLADDPIGASDCGARLGYVSASNDRDFADVVSRVQPERLTHVPIEKLGGQY